MPEERRWTVAVRPPYIGVTGFMDPYEVMQVRNAMRITHRVLMVGVLVSLKTLCRQPNKHARRYPLKDDVKKIFPKKHDRILNLVHYHTTETGHSLVDQLQDAVDVGGPNCDGIQLNIPWPDPAVLRVIRTKRPFKRIVLQVGSAALEQIQYRPDALVERLRYYVDLAHHVLLDPSGGHGKKFDAPTLLQYMDAIRSSNGLYYMDVGVAGGLGPHTLSHLLPISRKYKDISIDAEGQLRDSQDNLDTRAAQAYVRGALACFPA